ncbi:uncharacterized protein PGTG_05914 [Puccinia graminis f. sp. tritici CRL 75-36-700-3]|uniref:Uncharacterized protein n=1 Tax=Puccinia graminis f. sp. tritici (strain CRL 75-36-700-3 / race SCCL) TaxID=418459 RepID=E3K622_PUCGT|nr:uncharacterized protein PGTG_05914 [Puccinia graminis f. sp. tritici CRL 75-36-700-3]EFP79593.1 hypothetical protein PGTG_05914 [Puccinia graminis f. sp. tritici CRL 75-36-700-3]
MSRKKVNCPMNELTNLRLIWKYLMEHWKVSASLGIPADCSCLGLVAIIKVFTKGVIGTWGRPIDVLDQTLRFGRPGLRGRIAPLSAIED